MTQSNGEQITVDLSAEPREKRFVVGDPLGARSGDWKVVINRKGDFYVGLRSIMGLQKFSFHRTGHWQYAWTSQAAERFRIPVEQRQLDHWLRPPEHGVGLTWALRIWVSADDLTDSGPLTGKRSALESLLQRTAPGPNAAIGIHFAILRPNLAELEFTGIVPVWGRDLVENDERFGALMMYVSRMTITDDLWRPIADFRERTLSVARAAGADLTSPTLRMAAHFDAADGVKNVFDLDVSER